jgi:hypothetical protein
MTEAYTSYEAKVVGNGVSMLAGCAAFRTLVGAADATAAKSFILESWGGDHVVNANGDGNTATACDGSTVDLSAAFGSVHCERVPAELIGVGVESRSGEVQILVELPEPPEGETPGETLRRARNLGGTIRDQLRNQLGGADAFAVASIDFDGATIADNPSEAGSSWGARSIEIVLTIRFTA